MKSRYIVYCIVLTCAVSTVLTTGWSWRTRLPAYTDFSLHQHTPPDVQVTHVTDTYVRHGYTCNNGPITYLDDVQVPCDSTDFIDGQHAIYNTYSEQSASFDPASVFNIPDDETMKRCMTETACASGYMHDIQLSCPVSLTHLPIYIHTYYHIGPTSPPLDDLIAILPLSYLTTQQLQYTRFIFWTNDVSLLLRTPSLQHLQKYSPYVQLRRFDETLQFAACNVLHWYDSMKEYQQQNKLEAMWFTTYSDIVRLCLLHNYGGVWLDGDSMLMRDLLPILQYSQPLIPPSNNNFIYIPYTSDITRQQVIKVIQQFHFYKPETWPIKTKQDPESLSWCYNTPMIKMCKRAQYFCDFEYIPLASVDEIMTLPSSSLLNMCSVSEPSNVRYHSVYSFMYSSHHRANKKCTALKDNTATVITQYYYAMMQYVNDKQHFAIDDITSTLVGISNQQHQFCYTGYGRDGTNYYYRNMSICRPTPQQQLHILQQRSLAVKNSVHMYRPQYTSTPLEHCTIRPSKHSAIMPLVEII